MQYQISCAIWAPFILAWFAPKTFTWGRIPSLNYLGGPHRLVASMCVLSSFLSPLPPLPLSRGPCQLSPLWPKPAGSASELGTPHTAGKFRSTAPPFSGLYFYSPWKELHKVPLETGWREIGPLWGSHSTHPSLFTLWGQSFKTFLRTN